MAKDWILDQYAAAWWIRVILDAVEKYGLRTIPPILASRCPTFRRVHAILGLDLKSRNRYGLREWEIRPGLEARLCDAGFDPKTRNVIDSQKYQLACFSVDQRHEIEKAERARSSTRGRILIQHDRSGGWMSPPVQERMRRNDQDQVPPAELERSEPVRVVKMTDGQPSPEFERQAKALRDSSCITERSRSCLPSLPGRLKLRLESYPVDEQDDGFSDFGPPGVRQSPA